MRSAQRSPTISTARRSARCFWTTRCTTQARGRAVCNMAALQRATRKTQGTTRRHCIVQHAMCNVHHAMCNVHHAVSPRSGATRNVHHATCNTQRAPRNVQHATCTTQRATRNVQHATCRHNWRRHALRKRPDRYDGQGGLRPSAPARTYRIRIPTHGR